MTDAGFVIAGWTITGVVLASYWARVVIRTRRAERSFPPTGMPRRRDPDR